MAAKGRKWQDDWQGNLRVEERRQEDGGRDLGKREFTCSHFFSLAT
jgi:hypothetical protein